MWSLLDACCCRCSKLFSKPPSKAPALNALAQKATFAWERTDLYTLSTAPTGKKQLKATGAPVSDRRSWGLFCPSLPFWPPRALSLSPLHATFYSRFRPPPKEREMSLCLQEILPDVRDSVGLFMTQAFSSQKVTLGRTTVGEFVKEASQVSFSLIRFPTGTDLPQQDSANRLGFLPMGKLARAEMLTLTPPVDLNEMSGEKIHFTEEREALISLFVARWNAALLTNIRNYDAPPDGKKEA